MRLDDRVCKGWSPVGQGLSQGCVLAPPLFNIFFAVVINNVAYTRFRADKGEETNGAAAGEPALATSLWGMLYSGDAGVILVDPRTAGEEDGGGRGSVHGV